MMSAQEINIFTLEANQELPELVAPGKTALSHKTSFVSLFVKAAFAPALWCFTASRVFFDIRHKAMIEAGLACSFGIEGRVSMEERTTNLQAQSLERLEGLLQSRLDLKGIMMMAGPHSQAANDGGVRKSV